MKIGFDIGIASLRGTHIAIYDYASCNQSILGNESLLFYQKSDKHQISSFEKFKNKFHLIPYTDQSELNHLAEINKIDRFYLIKSGEKDSYVLSSTPNLIHAVFPQKIKERHGDIYAFVSEWLSEEYSNGLISFVPHIVRLPSHDLDLRQELAIPSEAIVFAYHGGADSFNLNFVRKVIQDIVEKNKHIFFMFMNIPSFLDHPQLIFLPGTSNIDYKVKFINTANAMIHARGIGESFGIACGEFSIKNKPIFTYALSPQQSHINILGQRGILYKGPKELLRLISDFDPKWASSKNWDCYSEKFSPKLVMEKFKSVFLDADINHKNDINENFFDKFHIQSNRVIRKARSLSRKYYLYFD